MSLGFTRDLLSIQPDIVFSIGGFGIANSTLMIFIIMLGFFFLGRYMIRTFSLIPGKFQVMMELLYTGVMDLVIQITNNENHARKIFPVIGTILVYFALANVIAIIPGLTDITYNGVAVLRTPTSDFNTAFGVSLATVLILNMVSIREWGILGYLGKFFNFKGIYLGFKKGLLDGFIGMVEFFVGVLDIIGELAKIISLTFRLFGNIYAGQVLAIIIMGALAYGLPTVWSVMSNFTGLLQGFVFATLVAVYYTFALKPEDTQE
jgi:F-type H+-transporting ATPase subunit a